MAGGALATGDGIGANAPRNVWAGILSVRLVFLSTVRVIQFSDCLVDLLCRLWWYSLRLRYRCHFWSPVYGGLVVHIRKTRSSDRTLFHHLFSTVPRRLHLVYRNFLRCSVCGPRSRFSRQTMVRCSCGPHLLCWRRHANSSHHTSPLHCRPRLRGLGRRNGFHAHSHVSIRVFSKVDSVGFRSFRHAIVPFTDVSYCAKQWCRRFWLSMGYNDWPLGRRRCQQRHQGPKLPLCVADSD